MMIQFLLIIFTLLFLPLHTNFLQAAAQSTFVGLASHVVSGAAEIAAGAASSVLKVGLETYHHIDDRLKERRREADRELGAARAALSAEQKRIDDLRARGQVVSKYDLETLGRLNHDVIAREAEVKRAEDAVSGMQKSTLDLIDGGVQALRQNMAAQATLGAEKEKIKTHGEQSRLWLETLMNRIKDPEYTNRALLLIGGGATLAAGGIYGTKVLASYYERQLGKPSLVRDTSRTTLLQDLHQTVLEFLGLADDQEELALDDIVIAQDQAPILANLVDEVKQANQLGLEYSHMLFYGPPGTGKTAFAMRLAQTTGLDFAIMSGADFAQFSDGEGVTELHKVLDWAESNARGTLLFIDEADACFRDRAALSTAEREVVNALLSRTGSPSKKFCIVFATNFKDELDSAVLSRISQMIAFNLPSVEDRFKIIMKKFKKFIVDHSRVVKKDDHDVEYKLAIDASCNEAFLQKIARQAENFSGRDLEQLILDVRSIAYRSPDQSVTAEIFEKVFANKKIKVDEMIKTIMLQKHKRDSAA